MLNVLIFLSGSITKDEINLFVPIIIVIVYIHNVGMKRQEEVV